MITVRGKYNTAVCFTPALEERAEEQIKAVCDQIEFASCKIRIMPDVHAGMGCTIGTTMTITDKIVPGMVGVDIGCGMETARLSTDKLDFARLDEVIREHVPSGFNIRTKTHKYADEIDLSALRCAGRVNLDRAYKSIGTLGGGNHFIEVGRSEPGEHYSNDNNAPNARGGQLRQKPGELYIVVHSGSRHLGNEVAEFYQQEGYNALCGNAGFQIEEAIQRLKAEGRHKEIQSEVKELKKQIVISVPDDLAYVDGALFDDYIHDMKIIQQFAVLNRKAMMDVILTHTHLSAVEGFTTIHNYIDTDSMILRKGAVSAKTGEKLLIPINMRDGSLICVGKGNVEWNCSAPHGAGRIMSRNQAFRELSMAQYKTEMRGIYSTCVLPETLDESPMAYKPIDEIVEQIGPTAEIVASIKPVYNFKASEQIRQTRKASIHSYSHSKIKDLF